MYVLEDTYRDEYDLKNAYRKVCDALLDRAKTGYKEAKEQLEIAKKEQPGSLVEFRENEKLIAELECKKKRCRECADLHAFRKRAKPVVKKYKPKPVGKRVFGSQGIVESREDTAVVALRLSLISKFLTIASEYVSANVVRVLDSARDDVCEWCGTELDMCDANSQGGYVCSVCHSEKIGSASQAVHSNDNNEEVESFENFKRSTAHYDGTCPCVIPPIVYKELDEYFAGLGMPTGEEVRKMEPRFRFRGDTNPEMLRSALEAINRKYYTDIYKIGHEYWGWEIPDLTNYKEPMFANYRKTQPIFTALPQDVKQRVSSLSTQLRMWLELTLVGFECYRIEFKIPVDEESIANQLRLWKIMCDNCPDPDVYFIEPDFSTEHP